jgi:predicted phage-related endonuclease
MSKPHRDPKAIGSTTVAMLFDESPFGGPHDAYAQCVGLKPWDANKSPLTQHGHDVEKMLLDIYEREFKCELARQVTFVHPDNDLIVATPDGIVTGGEWHRQGIDLQGRIVEAKNVIMYVSYKWSQVKGRVPNEYYIQCQWHRGVQSSQYSLPPDPSIDLYPQIGGQPPEVFPIKYDTKFFNEILLPVALDFLKEHVMKETPPPIDYSKACREFLSTQYPAAYEEKAKDRKWIEGAAVDRILKPICELEKAKGEICDSIDYYKNEGFKMIGEAGPEIYGMRSGRYGKMTAPESAGDLDKAGLAREMVEIITSRSGSKIRDAACDVLDAAPSWATNEKALKVIAGAAGIEGFDELKNKHRGPHKRSVTYYKPTE